MFVKLLNPDLNQWCESGTHTSTRAACCEFLRMISFSLTFLSDCRGRKQQVNWQVMGLINIKVILSGRHPMAQNVDAHVGQTLSLKASNSLSDIFHGALCLSSWIETPSFCSSYSLKGATLSTNLLKLRSNKNKGTDVSRRLRTDKKRQNWNDHKTWESVGMSQ